MIVIVDYGMGNIRSVLHKIKKLKYNVIASSNPEEIANASKIILPGVGYFAAGMKNLIDHNMISVLNNKVIVEGTPILGICLGMQLFTEYSEEGGVDGLGWIEGATKKFSFGEKCERLRIPHVGWNTINPVRESPILRDIPEGMRFYFTHSYHVCLRDRNLEVATTGYGYDFTSVLQKHNIFGVQFHPEKSHTRGMDIIRNFIEETNQK